MRKLLEGTCVYFRHGSTTSLGKKKYLSITEFTHCFLGVYSDVSVLRIFLLFLLLVLSLQHTRLVLGYRPNRLWSYLFLPVFISVSGTSISTRNGHKKYAGSGVKAFRQQCSFLGTSADRSINCVWVPMLLSSGPSDWRLLLLESQRRSSTDRLLWNSRVR